MPRGLPRASSSRGVCRAFAHDCGVPRPGRERITDLRRGLDYLETRSELDVGRIGLSAPSGGSRTGLLVTAIETRYRSVMFSCAGLRRGLLSFVAGANPIGFAPHVRGPILMMHGKYDESAAFKTEAEPLFKLLPQPKRLLLYEAATSHLTSFLSRQSIGGWMRH